MRILIWIPVLMVLAASEVLAQDGYPFAPAGGMTPPAKSTAAAESAPPASVPKNPLDLPLTAPLGAGSGGVQSPLSPAPGGSGPVPLPLPEANKIKKQKKVDYDMGLDTHAPVTGRPVPPLGKLPDGVVPANPTVIHMTDGVTYEVKVSRWMPNRFATPFRAPKVVDASGAQIQTLNSDVFILPSGDSPFVVYIVEGTPLPGVKSPTLSMVLIPQERMPAQNIVVSLDAVGDRERGGNVSEEPYVQYVKKIFRHIVRGEVPQGFVKTRFEGKRIAVMGGVVEMAPVESYSGTNMLIAVYVLKNTGSQSVEINEESFYRERVRAVALYPDVVLLPGQETRLYVLADLGSAK